MKPKHERRVFFFDSEGRRLRGLVLSVRRRWLLVGAWMYRVKCSDGKKRTVQVSRCRGNKFNLGDYDV